MTSKRNLQLDEEKIASLREHYRAEQLKYQVDNKQGVKGIPYFIEKNQGKIPIFIEKISIGVTETVNNFNTYGLSSKDNRKFVYDF